MEEDVFSSEADSISYCIVFSPKLSATRLGGHLMLEVHSSLSFNHQIHTSVIGHAFLLNSEERGQTTDLTKSKVPNELARRSNTL